MRTLNSGYNIPRELTTTERIFKIETFDNEMLLCNVSTAKGLLKEGLIKNLWHLWNFEFKRFSKLDLKEM